MASKVQKSLPKGKDTQNNSRKVLPGNYEEVHFEKGDIIEITKDMIIGDVVLAYPETLEVFKKVGIHCVGCYASTFESIQEGVLRHGIDPDKICMEVNKTIKGSHKKAFSQ